MMVSKENKAVQTCPSPVMTETESDEVEIRKPKSLNFKRVITKSVRGSIRLVKGIRPKTENDSNNKGKNLKCLFISFYINYCSLALFSCPRYRKKTRTKSHCLPNAYCGEINHNYMFLTNKYGIMENYISFVDNNN